MPIVKSGHSWNSISPPVSLKKTPGISGFPWNLFRYRNWGAQGSWRLRVQTPRWKGQVTPKNCDESLVWYGKMFRRLESKLKKIWWTKNYWKINYSSRQQKHSTFIKRKEDKKNKNNNNFLLAFLFFVPPKICHQKKKTSQNSSSWRSEPKGFFNLWGGENPQEDHPTWTDP